MSDNIAIVLGIFERGLIFSLVVASVYITSRVIKFDDLTVEGSFGLGSAITAVSLLKGINPWLSIIAAAFMGSLCGLATGLLHTKLKLNNLMSGIVVTTGLFSVILKIASSHKALPAVKTIFTGIPTSLEPLQIVFVLILTVGFLMSAVGWFLRTEIGFLLQALGNNPHILTALGKSIDAYKLLALSFANTLTAIAGALFVQYVGYFSIWASVGTLVTALAGLILAELISAHFGLSIIIGALIYQAVIAATFELQVDPDLNRLITAVLIIILLAFKRSTKIPGVRR